MWEYNRIEISVGSKHEIVEELNNLGEEDWELIHYGENKPEKFGDDWISVVIVKRLKNKS